jgi:hypothetical protein
MQPPFHENSIHYDVDEKWGNRELGTARFGRRRMKEHERQSTFLGAGANVARPLRRRLCTFYLVVMAGRIPAVVRKCG